MTQARSTGAATVRLLILGKRLRDLRQNAGLSFEDAARLLDVSALAIRRMEQGQVKWKIPYIKILLDAYGVVGDEAGDFLALTARANEPGWWYRYRDVLPSWFRAYVSLEEEASLIRGYEPHYVPGLLQTEEYARAVLRAGLLATEIKAAADSEQELERRVALRMDRQRLLGQPKVPDLWFVLDETALRRLVVPAEVMRAQIDHLIEACAAPNIKLQIIPFALTVHEGMYGPFNIFRFPHPELRDIVYLENVLGAVYLDQYEDVVSFQQALDRMSAQALPLHRTESFLGAIRKEI